MTASTEMVAPAPTQVVGVPMMTADEAESCLAKIKAGIHDIRALALDLREREGWRALGHKSWRACVKAEFDTSIATLYRQLRAAEIDRDVSQVETIPVRLPTVQAAELARLPDAPSRQAAYLAAKQATGGSLTQAAVRDAVDRTSKPSVRSERDASDNQAMPDDDVSLGFDPGPDDLGAADSQEPYARPSPFCSQCGPFKGERCDCPPVVAGGSVSADVDVTVWVDKIRQAIASGAVKDGAEVAMDVPAICPAMPFDGNTNMQILRALHVAGLISSDGSGGTPRWTLTPRTAPVAAQETPDAAGADPSGRTASASVSSSVGGKSTGTHHTSTAGMYRAPVVDGVAPQPVYPTAEGYLNGIDSNLEGQQLDEFAMQFGRYYSEVQRRRSQTSGQAEPEAETCTESVQVRQDVNAFTREYTNLFTSGAIAEAIVAETPTGAVSIAQGLVDRLPAEQLGAIVHRAQVRQRNAGQADAIPPARKSVAQIEADFPDDLTSGERVTLAMRLLKPVDLKAFVTFESQVPMLRKEIGAREREAAKAAVV